MSVERDDQPDASIALAEMVASTGAADLPSAALNAARYDILDTLGCGIAGRTAMGVAEVTAVLLGQGGVEGSAVWGSGSLLPAAQAAFVNGMASHALDYDDIHPGVTHTGVSVIPAALAAAEAAGVTDIAEVVAAVVTATEVADRIALAVTDGPGVTGWLLTPLVGYFGAAAAAARMFGLAADKTLNALGFAYVQTSGNGQSTLDGALAKRMQPGFAARGGVFGAELSRAGLTAPTNGLEGPRGFYNVYHRGRYDPVPLRRHDSDGWLIERATYKPYPCCGWTHAALECAVWFAEQGIAAADIRRIEVGTNAQAYRSVGTPLPRRYNPQTPVDAQFSIPYTFATAFVTGGIALADFSDAALRRPEVLELAALVRADIDPQLDAEYGRVLSPARAVVHLADGSTLEHVVVDPRGGETRPLTQEQLRTKYAECCDAAGLRTDVADQIAELVLGTTRGSVQELCELLRAAP
ncbi:MAG: putative 2-methylcitrate dehydratase PrpD [Marmoricola sp.]|nr:putative 2-methylcitrate dehydratase PrpD [Marmoricola sp.]